MIRTTNLFSMLSFIGLSIALSACSGDSAGGSMDTTPDAFAFSAVVDQLVGATVSSETITITGIDDAASISITGGEYSVDEASFTSVEGTIEAEQSISVRGTASQEFSTSVDVVLTVGGVTGTFTITTEAQDVTPDAFSFTAVTDVEVGSLETSNAISVGGINDAASISITGGEYSVDGGAYSTTDGTVISGQSITVQGTASQEFSTSVDVVLTIGGVTGTFSITTEAQDITPDAFSFTAVTDVEVDTLVTSNEITVSGMNDAAPVTITGGEYSVDGGAFTSVDGSVSIGQTVSVRHTTSVQNVTLTETTLTIGGTSAVFASTTKTYEGQLALIADGADLVLLGIGADGAMMERSRASLAEQIENYSPNHVIFAIAKHPSKNTVFVSSFNECGAGDKFDDGGCWGNGRIDRFTYDSNTVSWDGLAYLAQGPLRTSNPAYDAATNSVSMDILNQWPDNIQITVLDFVGAETSTTFTTTCTDVSLANGESCNVTVTAAEGLLADGALSITTSDIGFSSALYYSDNESVYVNEGLIDDIDSFVGYPDCVFDDFDEANQLGGCAMTAIAISTDGTRAYINEDDKDTALVFEIDENDDFLLLTHDEVLTDLQGIAVNADNTAIYNGSRAYSIDADSLTLETSGIKGNATEVFYTSTSETLLVSTISNSELHIYELDSDPLAPTEVATLTLGAKAALFQDHSTDLSVFAVVGATKVSGVTFDGTTLTPTNEISFPGTFDECAAITCDYAIVARGVQVSDDGLLGVASQFVNIFDHETEAVAPYVGAATSFSIDPTTQELTELERITFNGMSRALLFVATP